LDEEAVKIEEVMVVKKVSYHKVLFVPHLLKKVRSEKKLVQDRHHHRGYTLSRLDILWDTRSCRLFHHVHILTHTLLFHDYGYGSHTRLREGHSRMYYLVWTILEEAREVGSGEVVRAGVGV
jgi:hypothetical protein